MEGKVVQGQEWGQAFEQKPNADPHYLSAPATRATMSLSRSLPYLTILK